jgi:WD40 repeat protein
MNIAFTPDGRSLLSCGADGVYLWPLDAGEATGRQSIPTRGWCYGDTLAFTRDGKEVLNCFIHAYLQPLDGRAGRFVFRQKEGSGAVLGGCTIDSSGRYAALTDQVARPPDTKRLRVVELETGKEIDSWPLAPKGESDDGYHWAGYGSAFSADSLIVGGNGGIRAYDLGTGAMEWIWPKPMAMFSASEGVHRLLAVGVEEIEGLWTGGTRSELLLFEQDGTRLPIASHGTSVRAVALDEAGEVMVTGDYDGVVRVGWTDGSEPHLLMGHAATVERVALSADGRWIASKAGADVRLWPMPDLSEPPLHTLPYDELMAKLRSFTNLEVVEDEASSTGYRLEVGPFLGWKDVPEW